MKAAEALVLVAVLLVVLLIFGAGAGVGAYTRAGTVEQLRQDLSEANAQVAVEKARADGEVASLKALRETLKAERERRQQMQNAATEELAKRDGRIAALEKQAQTRSRRVTTEANKDDSCNALRTLAVCKPLADGLFEAAEHPH